MKPNVLLITADDLNYDSVGVYGCPVEGSTPNIDRLARQGIRFEHAHVTIAVCQPSRSAMMTGRYPHRNGACGFQPIREDVPTLTEQLHAAGYLNGIIGKEDHLAPRHKFCWDAYTRTMEEESGLGRSPQVYYRHALQFMNQAGADGRPFFLMANSHDPHRPFAGSDQEREQFGHHTEAERIYRPEEIEVPPFLPDVPDVRKEVAQYYTSVRRLDDTVGALLQALRDSGMEEQTVVIFLSDNGMAFPFAKTNCYLNSTKTPWIMRWPGEIKPGTVDRQHMIAGIDLMPTVLEIAGLPHPVGLDGRSFLPVLRGEAQSGREGIFTVFHRTAGDKAYPMRCYQNRSCGYIYNAWSDQHVRFENESQSGLTFRAMEEAADDDLAVRERVRLFLYRTKEEFYDLQLDPHALMNRINDPAYQERITELRQGLLRHMMESGDDLLHRFEREVT
ncbi:sulfatase [Paenibacillus sp. 1P07SE]|uniref:sulfatase family protein n=1 Tax=Paenibacillus sp. 1P07SE TaxID=3132209 RepID=UPI0039A689B9